jgi:hypothetical protein
MNDARRLRGPAYDRLIWGLIMAGAYLVRPESWPHYMAQRFPGHLVSGRAVGVVFQTLFAWAPYVVSWMVSRALLADRRLPTLVFVACASAIALGTGALYVHSLESPVPMRPSVLSLCITIALIAVAAICLICSRLLAKIWSPNNALERERGR